jgi:prepilin-type N-terminal cleavage/methylation domain-containing protein
MSQSPLKSGFKRDRRPSGFTLIELLVVMVVVAVLAGLIVAIAGLVTGKSGRSRAEAEIRVLELGCDDFKSDNGTYPHQPLAVGGSIPAVSGLGVNSNIPSDLLDPRTNGNSQPNNASYANASLELYQALTGDLSNSGTGGQGSKNYISGMKPDTFGRNNPSAPVSATNQVTYVSDPFGNCWGYSTANSTSVSAAAAPNPGSSQTFDLWSTSGSVATPYNGSSTGPNAPGAPGDPTLQWIKSW